MIHTGCGGGYAPSSFVLPGTQRKYPRSRPFSIRHLALDLDLLVEAKKVSGLATLEFERADAGADTLELDAVGFEMGSVKLVVEEEPQNVIWNYDGDRLYIAVPKEVTRATVEIEYSVTPRRGLYFLEPDAEVPNRPRQVWSQCQDQDARYWFPCHDSPDIKMTSELRVSVPEGWVALSNGDLQEEPASTQGERIFHFAFNAPHPSYLLTLVAGEFSILEDRPANLPDGRKVPVTYFVPKGREEDAWRSFSETPALIELFSRVTGVPFPWSRYSQIVVSDFTFGGMENTTATTLYEYSLLSERAAIDVSSTDLVAHELAHQWFGDFVTCRDWSEAWLNEGFATFFEHVAREGRLGRDEYDWGVLTDLEVYLGESNGHYVRPIVSREYQAPIDLFDRHLYQKGGLVLHMLRRELGDQAFWKGVHEYLVRNKEGSVETTDLKRAFEQASGHALDRFFDQWVYQPGHLELEVKASYEQGQLTVTAEQRLAEGATPLSYTFEIEICTSNGEIQRHSRVVNERQASHVVALASRPKWVGIDPDLRIASPLTVEMPSDFNIAALSSAASLRARVLAAQALSKRTDIPSITALRQCLIDDQQPWMLRAECARCLGKIAAPESLSTLAAATRIEHPKVRRAVASALSAFKQLQALEALKPLAVGDESYLVVAEACRSIGNTRQPEALSILRSQLGVDSHADLVRAAVYDGLAALRDSAAIDTLMAGTRYGMPPRGRRAAIAALGALGTERKEREHLEELLSDSDFYIRVEAARALVRLGDPRACAALTRQLNREHEGRVVREIRESLNALGTGGADQVKRLGDEMRQLQRRVEELNARVDRAGQLSSASNGTAVRQATQVAPAKRAKASPQTKKKVKRAVSKPKSKAVSRSRKRR